VDHEIDVLEFEPDDLQKIPGEIGSDSEDYWWVGVWFEVEDGDGVLQGVVNSCVVDAVLVRGAVDFPIKTIS
jgi:hypothetical protein